MPGPAGCLALHPPGVGATNKVTGVEVVMVEAVVGGVAVMMEAVMVAVMVVVVVVVMVMGP